MKALLSLFLIAAMAVSSVNALAQDDAQSYYDSSYRCIPWFYPKTSTNSIYAPSMYSGQYEWSSQITVTNISKEDVQVTIELRTLDGDVYMPEIYQLEGGFSKDNDPLHETGATLPPQKSARLEINADSYNGQYTAKITWEADGCLYRAMTGAIRNVYDNGSHYDQGLVFLNGGNPF